MKIAIVFAVILSFIAGYAIAQGGPLIIEAQPFTHTSCSVAAGQTRMCIVTDGVWVSENGAAYVKLGTGGTAGVLSFNGQVGNVIYTPPVTSVQGKTGAVLLTSTAPTIN